jgi:hypothetical protein
MNSSAVVVTHVPITANVYPLHLQMVPAPVEQAMFGGLTLEDQQDIMHADAAK